MSFSLRYWVVNGVVSVFSIFSCWLSTEKGTIFAFIAPMIIIIIVSIYPSLSVNDSIYFENLSDQLSVSGVGTSGTRTQQKAEGQNYKQR